jgi:acyl-CoA thioester hydrolase
MIFYTQFNIRWSEIDANRHLIHTAYSAYMAECRMAFLLKYGIDLKLFESYKIGPVLLSEHMHFIKEIYPGETITVSLEISGYSEDGKFIRFIQKIYNMQGKIAAYAEPLISWVDYESRKLSALPSDWWILIAETPKSSNFQILQKEDIRYTKVPYSESIMIENIHINR